MKGIVNALIYRTRNVEKSSRAFLRLFLTWTIRFIIFSLQLRFTYYIRTIEGQVRDERK